MRIILNGNQHFSSIEEFETYVKTVGHSAQYHITEDETLYLVSAQIINPENRQRLVWAVINQSDLAYEQAKIELTVTTPFHSWGNTVADSLKEELEELLEDDEEYTIANLAEDIVLLYNSKVRDYNDVAQEDVRELVLETPVTSNLLEEIGV